MYWNCYPLANSTFLLNPCVPRNEKALCTVCSQVRHDRKSDYSFNYIFFYRHFLWSSEMGEILLWVGQPKCSLGIFKKIQQLQKKPPPPPKQKQKTKQNPKTKIVLITICLIYYSFYLYIKILAW